MFGILFLVIIPLCIVFYISIITPIVKKLNGIKKISLIVIAFGLPIAYPFLHLIAPNYQNFKSLCRNNEYKLFKPIKTDVFPAPYSSGGYKALIEKPYTAFIKNSRIYRLTNKSNSDQCNNSCSTFDTQCLKAGCLTVEQLAEDAQYIEYHRTYDTESQRGIFNSLLRKSTERLVSDEHGILAEKYNYHFYLYGTGWAKILGAASGSAPSYSCESYSKFNYYEITPPVKGV